MSLEAQAIDRMRVEVVEALGSATNLNGDALTLQGASLNQARSLPFAYLVFLKSFETVSTQIHDVKFDVFYSQYAYKPQYTTTFFENPASPDDHKIRILEQGLYLVDFRIITSNHTYELYLDLMFETYNVLYSGPQIGNRVRAFDFPSVTPNFAGGQFLLFVGDDQPVDVWLRMLTPSPTPISYTIENAYNIDPSGPKISPYVLVYRLGDNLNPVRT